MKCNGSRHTGPIHEYSHATNCESITGGAFVPNDRSWPDEYDDSYLFADFVCNRIFELRPDGAGFDRTVFGPSATKDLYYMTFGGGQVRRIAHNPGP